MTFFRLSNIAERLGVLGRKFAQSFLVEMNAAFLPVDLALEFQTALLQFADLMFQN